MKNKVDLSENYKTIVIYYSEFKCKNFTEVDFNMFYKISTIFFFHFCSFLKKGFL